MSARLDRVGVLMQQSRFKLAEQELRQELAEDPHQPYAHAMLALCLAGEKKYAEAQREAEAAVHLVPDLAYCHYVLASGLADQDRFADAEPVAREALRLDPEDADYYALLSRIQLGRRRWLPPNKACSWMPTTSVAPICARWHW